MIFVDDKVSRERYQSKAADMAKTMLRVNAARPDRLLPIYDIDGNLLWPKEMSYEQVKKFVAERDAKKKTEKEIDSRLRGNDKDPDPESRLR